MGGRLSASDRETFAWMVGRGASLLMLAWTFDLSTQRAAQLRREVERDREQQQEQVTSSAFSGGRAARPSTLIPARAPEEARHDGKRDKAAPSHLAPPPAALTDSEREVAAAIASGAVTVTHCPPAYAAAVQGADDQPGRLPRDDDDGNWRRHARIFRAREAARRSGGASS